ncbi:M12 family metallopeptidase [Elongatibacter sediminis]|uniref:M12 family metallopeptidase n=1 Tax=Elongatibacter sediminis TaxID=3119006 RepID=A0AAW9RAC9_9GAMM
MKKSVAVAATALCLTVAAEELPWPVDAQRVADSEKPWMWRNGRFTYELSPEVARDPMRRAVFEQACRELVSGSALRCVSRGDPEASGDTDYVYVVDGPANHSMVGRQGGRQRLGIRSWNNRFKVAHEIKHALGWAHEQQHPLRDRYVEVLFDNIPPVRHIHFEISDLGNEGPYDFDSVMHYYPTDFALPARRSLRARPSHQDQETRMGQRNHLSETDLLEIRLVYGFPESRQDSGSNARQSRPGR